MHFSRRTRYELALELLRAAPGRLYELQSAADINYRLARPFVDHLVQIGLLNLQQSTQRYHLTLKGQVGLSLLRQAIPLFAFRTNEWCGEEYEVGGGQSLVTEQTSRR